MKKTLFTVLIVLICSLCAWSKPQPLKFNANGKFKILQLTDLHLVKDSPKSEIAYENIKSVITAEKPDLIFITGDIIYSKPAADIFNHIMKYISSFKIPYALAFGNHDHQFGMENKELLEIASKYPLCITTTAEGVNGACNCDITVKDSAGKDAWVLYSLDSGDNSQLEEAGVKGYDYIHHDQIQWYIDKSREYKVKNNGKPLPALAFFHIPIPEYQYALLDNQAKWYGHKGERPSVPVLNTGLFSAMKEMGDVKGTFVGHDHDSDFIANYYGIMLAFGRFSGGDTEYNNLKPNGARVIELTEGKDNFATWIRLRTGEVEQMTVTGEGLLK